MDVAFSGACSFFGICLLSSSRQENSSPQRDEESKRLLHKHDSIWSEFPFFAAMIRPCFGFVAGKVVCTR